MTSGWDRMLPELFAAVKNADDEDFQRVLEALIKIDRAVNIARAEGLSALAEETSYGEDKSWHREYPPPDIFWREAAGMIVDMLRLDRRDGILLNLFYTLGLKGVDGFICLLYKEGAMMMSMGEDLCWIHFVLKTYLPPKIAGSFDEYLQKQYKEKLSPPAVEPFKINDMKGMDKMPDIFEDMLPEMFAAVRNAGEEDIQRILEALAQIDKAANTSRFRGLLTLEDAIYKDKQPLKLSPQFNDFWIRSLTMITDAVAPEDRKKAMLNQLYLLDPKGIDAFILLLLMDGAKKIGEAAHPHDLRRYLKSFLPQQIAARFDEYAERWDKQAKDDEWAELCRKFIGLEQRTLNGMGGRYLLGQYLDMMREMSAGELAGFYDYARCHGAEQGAFEAALLCCPADIREKITKMGDSANEIVKKAIIFSRSDDNGGEDVSNKLETLLAVHSGYKTKKSQGDI